MYKLDYLNKVEHFLSENNFNIIEKNPLSSFTLKTKSIIDKTKPFLDEFNSPKVLVPSNPVIPRMYGLPKIHKDNIPIRPIVSYTNSPVYFLSKFLNNFLSNNINFFSKHSIKNSLELISKIKDFNIE